MELAFRPWQIDCQTHAKLPGLDLVADLAALARLVGEGDKGSIGDADTEEPHDGRPIGQDLGRAILVVV